MEEITEVIETVSSFSLNEEQYVELISKFDDITEILIQNYRILSFLETCLIIAIIYFVLYLLYKLFGGIFFGNL